MIWSLITAFGDSASLLPAAAVIQIWLIVNGLTRSAVVWLSLFLGETVLVTASKILFIGWGIGIETFDFTGISGHATLGTSVLTTSCYLAMRCSLGRFRAAAGIFGLAMGALVALSRVILGFHSVSEACAGWALGTLVSAVFIWAADRKADRNSPRAAFLTSTLATLFLMLHGSRAPADGLITQIALGLSGPAQPYIRQRWHEIDQELTLICRQSFVRRRNAASSIVRITATSSPARSAF